VELEIAPDIMTQIGEVEIIEKEIFSQPQPFDSDIQRAVELIVSSKQPTIIAGGGTILSGASEEVTRLAELIQAAVMTTPQGKGVIDENSHLSVGVNSAIGPAGLVLPESDLVIAVGTRLSPRGVQLEVMPTLIQIDIDPSEIGRRFDAEVGIIGDARQCLSAILSKLETVSIDTGSRNEDVLALRKKFKDEVERLAPRQLSIIDSIRNALHDDAIVVQGETNIGHWSSVAFTVGQPKTYLASSYFGTLGYSYPTALGCQAAFPGRQVIALCGDGGFMYSPQELSTAMTYGLNVVAVVFNNGSFGSSKWDQEKAFSGRYIGTDLVNPDFVLLAESFGAVGVRTNAEGIGDAIKDAFSRNSPVVVDVEIENMMPPFQIVE
jgi:acetolactate synthase-1/2/3 large subunit